MLKLSTQNQYVLGWIEKKKIERRKAEVQAQHMRSQLKVLLSEK